MQVKPSDQRHEYVTLDVPSMSIGTWDWNPLGEPHTEASDRSPKQDRLGSISVDLHMGAVEAVDPVGVVCETGVLDKAKFKAVMSCLEPPAVRE